MKNVYKKIGNQFKTQRLNLRKSQKQIADIIGKDRSTYGYYEQGKLSIDIDTYLKICNALKLNPKELISSLVDRG